MHESFKMKGLIFILDGLGDRPCAVLNDKTPLQHADTPTLDHLVSRNQSGLMNPLGPGLPVDTHTGVSMLFGVPPVDAVHIKRGPIEAAGIDLDLQSGDLFLRSNLATVDSQSVSSKILDRRAQRIDHGVDEICASLQNMELGNGITASLFPATHHRCVLRLRGNTLSDQISDTDPGGKNIKEGILQCEALDASLAASLTANAVNRFTAQAKSVLIDHPVNLDRIKQGLLPANAVITRSCGQLHQFNNRISDLNLNISVIAGEATILGLGKMFGFNTITNPAFTADTNSSIELKVKTAIQALNHAELVFIHLKGTDTTAHDRDPLGKSEFISRFDAAISQIDVDEIVLGVCADHSTDSISGEHNGDAVPVLIHNPAGRSDRVERYNEIDCANGALGRIDAQGYITSVLDAMGHIANFKSSDAKYYEFNHKE